MFNIQMVLEMGEEENQFPHKLSGLLSGSLSMCGARPQILDFTTVNHCRLWGGQGRESEPGP